MECLEKYSYFAIRIIVCFITLLSTSCSSIGSDLVPANRENFSTALLKSDEEQLLLNIVRMQYGDRPYFLGIDNVSVSNSLSISSAPSVSVSRSHSSASPNPGGSISNSYSVAPSFSYSDSPTVIFSPLQGENFIHEMLAPIGISNITLLVESGWSVARVLRITTRHIGPLDNASGTARPSTKHIPAYLDFVSFAHYLRRLQTDGIVKIKPGKVGEFVSLDVIIKKQYRHSPEIKRLLQMLQIKHLRGNIQFVDAILGATGSAPTTTTPPGGIVIGPQVAPNSLPPISGAPPLPAQSSPQNTTPTTVTTSVTSITPPPAITNTAGQATNNVNATPNTLPGVVTTAPTASPNAAAPSTVTNVPISALAAAVNGQQPPIVANTNTAPTSTPEAAAAVNTQQQVTNAPPAIVTMAPPATVTTTAANIQPPVVAGTTLPPAISPPPSKVIRLIPRSFISVLYYLAKSVEIQEDDVKSGLVIVPQLASGEYFDWSDVTRGMMKIHSSSAYPQNATVAVRYRGRWFYIEDTDNSSKETLALVEQLFSLQAGLSPSTPPLITLNVGH